MIHIFDDNEYRLAKLRKAMIKNKLFVKATSYEYYDFHTKPIITVLVSPKREKIREYLNEKDTVFVLVVKKNIPETALFRNVIVNPEAEVTPEQIREIIKKEYGYDLVLDCVNHILIDDEDKDIYFGLRRLFLTRREYEIVRFFAYNKDRIFTIDDVLEYLNLVKSAKPESLMCYFSKINGKCKDNYRESLILHEIVGYRITPVYGSLKRSRERKAPPVNKK